MHQQAEKAHPHVAAPSGSLDGFVSAGLAILGGLFVAGLLLAMAGIHHAWLQGPLAVAIAIPAYRWLPRNSSTTSSPRPVLLALGIVIVVAVVTNYMLRSELLMAGRDGATYSNTAAALIDDGGLFPTAVAPPFEAAALDFEAPGFVLRDDGTLWQQFLHSTSTVFAFFGEILGPSAIFGVNALLSGFGILMAFALARRFMAPWWALLAACAIAASLPFLYFSRATFSEIATLVFSLGGLWAAHIALTEQPRAAMAAGAVLGLAAMVRVDAWMFGVAIGATLLTTQLLGEEDSTPVASAIFTGFAVTAAIGLVDLAFFAEPYLVLLGNRIFFLIFATIGLRVLSPLFTAARVRRLSRALERHHTLVVGALTVLLSVGVLYLWFIRPVLPRGPAGGYGISELQLAEGLPAEPRSYIEDSVWWLVWYLGLPIVAAGFLGAIAAARNSLSVGTTGLRLLTLSFLVPAAIYLVKPSINPDHVWASRRFLPVVIPALAVSATAVAAWFWDRLADSRRRRPIGALLVAAVVVPVLVTSVPLIGEADRPGVAGQVEAMCASFGDAQSILILNDDPDLPLSWLVGPPLRAWCGLTVAAADVGSPAAATTRADLVMAGESDLLPNANGTRHQLEAQAWMSRLTGPPNELETRSLTLWVGRR